MKKKRTLNQTWTLCLRMWKWIAKVWQTKGYESYDVHNLKRSWLEENGFNSSIVRAHCFFCACKGYGNDGLCSEDCPGALVDSGFSCRNDDYNYETKPVEFYKELLRLNRMRKVKK